MPDGSFDYEAVEALNLPLLEQCMQELLSEGKTNLPVFDFLTHSPSLQTSELCITDDSVVIFEGIHALNPLLRRHLPQNTVFTVFINVMSSVSCNGEELLSSRDIRLARRLLRDVRFRNSSLDNTLDMWRQVVRGEDLYLFPNSNTADAAFDTTHAYEPAMIGALLLHLLMICPCFEEVKGLARALEAFYPLSDQYLPQDALLREFIG